MDKIMGKFIKGNDSWRFHFPQFSYWAMKHSSIKVGQPSFTSRFWVWGIRLRLNVVRCQSTICSLSFGARHGNRGIKNSGCLWCRHFWFCTWFAGAPYCSYQDLPKVSTTKFKKKHRFCEFLGTCSFLWGKKWNAVSILFLFVKLLPSSVQGLTGE